MNNENICFKKKTLLIFCRSKFLKKKKKKQNKNKNIFIYLVLYMLQRLT